MYVFYCQYFFMRRDLLHKIQFYVFFLSKKQSIVVKLIQLSIRFRPNFQTVCLVSANIDGEIETYISQVKCVYFGLQCSVYRPMIEHCKESMEMRQKMHSSKSLCLPVSDGSGFLILGFGFWKYVHIPQRNLANKIDKNPFSTCHKSIFGYFWVGNRKFWVTDLTLPPIPVSCLFFQKFLKNFVVLKMIMHSNGILQL